MSQVSLKSVDTKPRGKFSSLSPDQLHDEALQVARNYRRVESDLLDVLQRIEGQRAFLALGYPSLFEYAVHALDLTESIAFMFIRVARRAREVPELKTAIDAGNFTVSKAARISSVITPENKDEWLQKAAKLTKRELETEVLRFAPELERRAVLRQVSADDYRLHIGLSGRLVEKLKRAQTLEASKAHLNLSLEDTLERVLDDYLRRRDPLKRVSRKFRVVNGERTEEVCPGTVKTETLSESKPESVSANKSRSSATKDERLRRDGGCCQYVAPDGRKCLTSRFVEVHHCVPISEGGLDVLDNMITLCWRHHHWRHLQEGGPTL